MEGLIYNHLKYKFELTSSYHDISLFQKRGVGCGEEGCKSLKVILSRVVIVKGFVLNVSRHMLRNSAMVREKQKWYEFSVNEFTMNFPIYRGNKFKFATGTHTLPFIHVDLLLTVTCHAIITNFPFKKLIYGFSDFFCSASRQCPSPSDDGVSGCAAVGQLSSWKKFDF